MDKENPKKDGDEEGESKKDFQDPAIISAITGGITSELPAAALIEHRYSKEELLKLRKVPHSQRKPKFLEAAHFNTAGVWDPEQWHYSNKHADSQGENGGGGGGGNAEEAPPAGGGGGGKQRSRPSDPRERLRKEQDGIVLSPQRRSFISGCCVPNSRENASATAAAGATLPIRANRAHSPLGGEPPRRPSKSDRDRDRDRDREPMQRRIGSGRILWDYPEKPEEENFGYRREISDRRDRERERELDRDRRNDDGHRERDDRFERRSFGRDFDSSTSAKEKHGRQSQGRGFNRRVNESREEEPEWFSSGPISQNDTIELRGFDDPPEKATKKNSKKRSVNSINGEPVKKLDPTKRQFEAGKENLIGKESIAGESPPVNNKQVEKQDKSKKAESPSGEKKKNKLGGPDEECFNFDAMFKADSLPIPELLSNGIDAGDAAGSRFSRWFQREKSPPKKPEERSSPQEHQHNLIRNLLGDSFNEPQTVAIPQPGDAESYFAPISPATNSHPPQAGQGPNQGQNQGHGHKHPQIPPEQTLRMIEMQQRATAAAAKKSDAPPGGGKILSLEELEASMRQGAPEKGVPNKTSEEDMQQFKRLFSQMNTNGPQMQPKPMSIMEMLSHSQQKDMQQQRMHQAPIPPPAQVQAQAQAQHMTEIAFKLQQAQAQRQQQFDMLSKLINGGNFGGGHQRVSPLQHEMGMAQSRELLNRPEAQAIMQGLKRGDITPQHLYQQLANPAMQPRHRDMLLTILKMQQPPPTAPPAPPAAVSPNMYAQPQQLRVSPLTPNAFCVSPIMATSPNTLSVPALHKRIPSPRELQVHTQNIMQRALIKKKLEEQEENYRKKQQQSQRGAAGSPAKSTASPTPLTFMPTSVMRKLTAEKDDSAKDGKDKVPQGRPLTGLRSGQVNPQHPQQQQQQQPNWMQQMKQTDGIFSSGRAIVKANNYQQNPAEYFQQQQQQAQQHRLMHQQHLPQQHAKNYYNQQQQQQQQPPPQQMQTSGGGGQYQQLNSQQLRQQHQSVRAQHQQQQPPAFPPGQAPSQSQNHTAVAASNWMGGAQAANFADANHHRGDLSPTSDQLARWFSPDLLERARKGNVPSIPTSAVAQHALSLEEIERQTTPVGQH